MPLSALPRFRVHGDVRADEVGLDHVGGGVVVEVEADAAVGGDDVAGPRSADDIDAREVEVDAIADVTRASGCRCSRVPM